MISDEEILAGLQNREKLQRQKVEKLRKPLIQAEEDLQRLVGAIELYLREAKSVDLEEALSETVSLPATKLRGMTQLSAVIAIAKSNGGVVRAQDAKRLMIKAGIMSATKNATNMTHNVILRSERFERIAPGEYKLKDSEHESDESFTIQDLRRSPVHFQ
jgi:hypothetical protein